jgi:hypothetical protein
LVNGTVVIELVDLIKQSRNEGGYNNTNQADQTNQKYFYLGNLQVTLLNQVVAES